MLQFSELLPDLIFDAISAQGFSPNGALLPLNSYENRVYEIGIEDGDPLIAKFYRPGRWSADAIWDEHRFVHELVANELPVVPPLELKHPLANKKSLAQIDTLFYAIYPKFRGREHSDLTADDRQWLGRTLARLHNIGEHFKAPHRQILSPQTYGYDNVDFILDQEFVPHDLIANLENTLFNALDLTEDYFSDAPKSFVIHGDCHLGNVLWNQEGLHLVDFDDVLIAPPVQDMWMLFSGTADEVAAQRDDVLEGYSLFREFDEHSFILTESLRTLRMIRHAAWIGKRYEEVLFQRTFPYYTETRYWEQFLLSLKEQIALLQQNAY